MTKLINPLEGSGFDPRHTDIAAESLKRGRRGQGSPVEVNVEGLGRVAFLDDVDRQAIAHLVDNASTEGGVEYFGTGLEKIVRDRLAQQEAEGIVDSATDC